MQFALIILSIWCSYVAMGLGIKLDFLKRIQLNILSKVNCRVRFNDFVISSAGLESLNGNVSKVLRSLVRRDLSENNSFLLPTLHRSNFATSGLV